MDCLFVFIENTTYGLTICPLKSSPTIKGERYTSSLKEMLKLNRLPVYINICLVLRLEINQFYLIKVCIIFSFMLFKFSIIEDIELDA